MSFDRAELDRKAQAAMSLLTCTLADAKFVDGFKRAYWDHCQEDKVAARKLDTEDDFARILFEVTCFTVSLLLRAAKQTSKKTKLARMLLRTGSSASQMDEAAYEYFVTALGAECHAFMEDHGILAVRAQVVKSVEPDWDVRLGEPLDDRARISEYLQLDLGDDQNRFGMYVAHAIDPRRYVFLKFYAMELAVPLLDLARKITGDVFGRKATQKLSTGKETSPVDAQQNLRNELRGCNYAVAAAIFEETFGGGLLRNELIQLLERFCANPCFETACELVAYRDPDATTDLISVFHMSREIYRQPLLPTSPIRVMLERYVQRRSSQLREQGHTEESINRAMRRYWADYGVTYVPATETDSGTALFAPVSSQADTMQPSSDEQSEFDVEPLDDSEMEALAAELNRAAEDRRGMSLQDAIGRIREMHDTQTVRQMSIIAWYYFYQDKLPKMTPERSLADLILTTALWMELTDKGGSPGFPYDYRSALELESVDTSANPPSSLAWLCPLVILAGIVLLFFRILPGLVVVVTGAVMTYLASWVQSGTTKVQSVPKRDLERVLTWSREHALL